MTDRADLGRLMVLPYVPMTTTRYASPAQARAAAIAAGYYFPQRYLLGIEQPRPESSPIYDAMVAEQCVALMEVWGCQADKAEILCIEIETGQRPPWDVPQCWRPW